MPEHRIQRDRAQRDRWQLRFGGMGGQGVVVLGDTIALAGALGGWHAAASTSYGAQARGGASKADVVLSPEPIDFPHVERPDVMVLVSQEAYEAYTVGELPPQLAARNRSSIAVQELAVCAVLDRDREAAFHAGALGPLTAAVASLDQIRAMFEELWSAEEHLLKWFDPRHAGPVPEICAA